MSTIHPAVDKWGMKKYGEQYDLPEGTTFELETGTEYHGYCETCSYEESVIRINVKRPGEKWHTEICYETTDLATIMREVLDAAMEK